MVLKPCICVFVYLCICVFSCETLANIDSDILVTLAFQKYSTCHVYQHFFPRTVFLYLCICICIFWCQTPGNIVFEVLLPLPFQKYSICHSYLQLWPMLYLRVCVFVYLYLCICKSDTQEDCFWGTLTITFSKI